MEKKNQCLFCKITTNDCLQGSERVKNVRPHTHRLFNDFAKKMCPCFGPHLFYCLAWQSCYIFKEKLLEYNMQSKKEMFESSFLFPYVFMYIGFKVVASSLKYMKAPKKVYVLVVKISPKISDLDRLFPFCQEKLIEFQCWELHF